MNINSNDINIRVSEELIISVGYPSQSQCKILLLPDADLPLTGDEYVEISQNGVCKKVKVSQLPGGGSSIPTNAVLYDDLTAVFYDDSSYVLYDN
jgi:hypothetical protein